MMTTQNKQFSIYGAVIEKLYDYLFGDGRARGIIQLCTFAVAFAYVLVAMLVFGKPTFSVVTGCVALVAALLVGVPIAQACLEVRQEKGSFLSNSAEHGLIEHSRPIVTVLDTCNDAGVCVDEKVREEIHQTIRARIANALIPDAPDVPLPNGIKGVVASVRKNLYVITMEYPTANDTDENEAALKRLLIHELQHVAQRLRAELPESRNRYLLAQLPPGEDDAAGMH